MPDEIVKIAYHEDEISSLDALQNSVERDEGHFPALVQSLERAKLTSPAGQVVILATYKVIPIADLPTKIRVGHIFFAMPVDGQTLDQLKTQQKTSFHRDFLFSCKLTIDDVDLDLAVFRPEPKK
jgi:hypothetical protein